jgi:hypothetical protein
MMVSLPELSSACSLCFDGRPLSGGVCVRCLDAIDEARGAGPRRAFLPRCGRCGRLIGATRRSDVSPRCRCHVVGPRRVRGRRMPLWETDKRPLFVRALIRRGQPWP